VKLAGAQTTQLSQAKLWPPPSAMLGASQGEKVKNQLSISAMSFLVYPIHLFQLKLQLIGR
jgi:hypothetical protein